jgi:hypothetical protein
VESFIFLEGWKKSKNKNKRLKRKEGNKKKRREGEKKEREEGRFVFF